ncbi:MAG: nickel-responsive transcriptional regulator NikR [Sedimentisphaeraceae bacterium JB056]
MSDLERIGVSLDKELLVKFDSLIMEKGYTARSEAFRDLIRKYLSDEKLSKTDSEAIAALTLIYDHHTPNLSQKLTELQHDYLLEVMVSTHLHLDHHNCFEIIILRGKVKEIESIVNAVKSLKGVKNAQVSYTVVIN